MDIQVIASSSDGNCCRISDGSTTLLLDAGIPFKSIQKAVDFKIAEIAGCFVTHNHGDHSKAVKDLIKASVDIYTSAGTARECGLTGHRVKIIKALTNFDVGTFTVTPFDVQHDVPEPLGFVFTSRKTGEKLLFFTDSYYIKYRFSGLTHIMGECNYDLEIVRQNVENGVLPEAMVPRLIKSHMSLDHFVDMLKANDLSKVKQIYLLHMSSRNADEKRFKETIQRLTGVEVYAG